MNWILDITLAESLDVSEAEVVELSVHVEGRGVDESEMVVAVNYNELQRETRWTRARSL